MTDVHIDNIDDFLRLRPIAPKMSLMDKRRELLGKLTKLQSSNTKNMRSYAIRVEQLMNTIKVIENEIMSTMQQTNRG